MKKIVITILAVLLFAIWIGSRREEVVSQTDQLTPTVPVSSSTRTTHPLSIEGLRTRSYGEGQIDVVRTVRQTDSFVSTVVSYDSDGLKQFALMNTPKGAGPIGGWPVVVVNHGHIPPKQYSTENSYINTSAYFANAGFLVLKPDYRGHDKSEGVADNLVSRIQYAVDVLNLMANIKTMPNVNSERIFMYGHSMGGDVTLRILEVNRDVKAATLWAPAVTTFPESVYYFRRNRDANQDRLLQAQKDFEELTRDAQANNFSPFDNLSLVQAPIIVHHGTADESVPYAWGVDLDKALRASEKQVTFYSYPNDNHDIAGNWGVALSRDVAFFNQY